MFRPGAARGAAATSGLPGFGTVLGPDERHAKPATGAGRPGGRALDRGLRHIGRRVVSGTASEIRLPSILPARLTSGCEAPGHARGKNRRGHARRRAVPVRRELGDLWPLGGVGQLTRPLASPRIPTNFESRNPSLASVTGTNDGTLSARTVATTALTDQLIGGPGGAVTGLAVATPTSPRCSPFWSHKETSRYCPARVSPR